MGTRGGVYGEERRCHWGVVRRAKLLLNHISKPSPNGDNDDDNGDDDNDDDDDHDNNNNSNNNNDEDDNSEVGEEDETSTSYTALFFSVPMFIY